MFLGARCPAGRRGHANDVPREPMVWFWRHAKGVSEMLFFNVLVKQVQPSGLFEELTALQI